MDRPHISVVSPVYCCKTCLYELCSRLKKTIEKITSDFEIILVNDASPDGAWDAICELANKDQRFKGINFSRNFGQHYAISAGLEYSSGNWVIVMDCDLQDRPEEISKLYEETKKGFQIVFAQRIQRKDNWLKKTFSRLFYALLGYLTNTEQDPSIANYGIYHRKVVDAICQMGDYHKYFPTMIRWVGFKSSKVEVSHDERVKGNSSYSIRKLIRLAIDVMLSFSNRPLKIIVKSGFLISFFSAIFAIYNLILFLNNKILIPGYTSLIISVWFLAGLVIMVLGIVGLYVGKIFDKVKNRPHYLIMNKTFNNDSKYC